MYARRNYRKRTVKKAVRKSSRRPAVKRGVSSAVKKYVSKTIHSNIENKVAVYASPEINLASYTNMINSLCAFPLTPYANYMQILNGTLQGDKIGNEVRTRKLMLRYIITPRAYDATYNPYPTPQHVKMWIGFLKSQPTAQNSDWSRFFQLGDTATAPTGLLQDLIMPINKDVWSIKKTLSHKIGFSSNTGSGSAASFGYLANNDFNFNVVKSVDLTSICPKVFKFNDQYSYTPTTGHALFMYVEAVDATGQASTNTQTIKLKYWLEYVYEDA